MALVGLFHKNESISDYVEHVFELEQWCKTSLLLINAGKTKELILNQTGSPTPLILSSQTIVNCFKYLGKHIDDKLNFTKNVDAICKKANQRLFLIRKLKGFGVSCNILEMTYVSLIESVLSNISVWYGDLTS